MSSNDTVSRRSVLKAAGGAAASASVAGYVDTDDAADARQGGGGTLTYARGNDSGTLDPQNTTSGEDVKVTNQIYDRLIEFEPGQSSLVAGLATEWNLEGKQVTLQLREGVTFHDGQEFTADDVVATYRRFTDPEYDHYPGDDYVSAYGPFTLGNWVSNVNKEGDYELTMELEQRYAPFLRNLAMFAASILSKEAIKKRGTDLSQNPVGTGAFQFESWDKSNQRIRVSAYDDYWGDGPRLSEVVFTAVGSNTTRAQTLTSGGADVVDGLGAQASQIVANADGATLAEKKGINIGYMAFNMARVEAFREKKVRQAISYAVNTEAIVNTIFKGIAVQASQPIPSNVFGYNEELDPYPHDPEKAQSLLEEAGYGDGFEFELATFKNPRMYNPSPLQAAQTVQSNLEQVGITMTINQMPFNPYLNYTSSGKHDACFAGWMTDNGDPDNFYYTLLHPGVSQKQVPDGQDWVGWDTEGFNTLDNAAWANTEFMNATEEAQKSYEQQKRAKLYKKAAEIAHEEAPWVFMDHAKELRGVGNNVENFVVAPIGGPFLERVTLKNSG